MISNLKTNIIDFMKLHGASAMDVEYVHYFSKELEENCSCDFGEFLDIVEEINFEDSDVLIKHREQINESLCIVGDEWYISRSDVPEAIWSFHRLPVMGDYNSITEDDIINNIDNIDPDVVELLSQDSVNLDYVRDYITINNETYIIECKDDIQRVVNNAGKVAIIMACNPCGQYWTQSSDTIKDPQILFYPELIKIVMEYKDQCDNSVKPGNISVKNGNIESVFNIAELSDKYSLNFDGIRQEGFNNLRVEFVPKDYDYQISFMGAAIHPDIRHEIIRYIKEDYIINV